MNGQPISILLLGLVVCVSCSTAQDVISNTISEDIKVAPSEKAAAKGACSSKGARELVEEFLSAYSTGSSSASLTDRFFAPDDRFQWFYDALTRHGEEATDRSSLDSYFAQQHASGDNLRLVSFSYGYRDEDNTGHFRMVLSRNELVLNGKGAIDCDSGKIMVWATDPASSTSKTQESMAIGGRGQSVGY